LGKITTDGSLEILGNSANNELDYAGKLNDHRGDTITRVRVGLGFPEITEGVSGRVEFIRNGSPNTMYGGSNPNGTTLTNEESIIRIQNGYVDIANFLKTDQFRIGRQYGGRKGDLLVYYGPIDDDALNVSALDSALVRKKVGPVDALFATGKVTENGAVPGNANDTDATVNGDINLTYLILSSSELFSGLRLPLEVGYYRATNSNAATTADNQTLVVYDARAGYGLMNDALNLSAEIAMNGGQDNNGSSTAAKSKFKGNAYVVKADYAAQDRGIGLRALYANASGQNQTSATWSSDKSFHDVGFSDFRYGEILSNSNTFVANSPVSVPGAGLDTGVSAGGGGRGLNVINVGVSYILPVWDGKLDASLDFYNAKVNKVAANASKKIGTEYDLALHYHHSASVTASAGYAMLSVGDGLANDFGPTVAGTTADNITKLFGKISIKWGGPREGDSEPVVSRPAARPATRAPARHR
jgi:hypothetical protein